jgi:hypothetical protein
VGQFNLGGQLPCGSNYPNDVGTVLVYGPFSLQDAAAAKMSFWTWSLTEDDYDTCFFGASTDGDTFGGTRYSGRWDDWANRELDLGAVPWLGNLLGKPQVWIGFFFVSDYIATLPHGWYVDDVHITKWVGALSADAPEAQPKTWDAGEPVLMQLRRR